jgi:hypothetical protein
LKPVAWVLPAFVVADLSVGTVKAAGNKKALRVSESQPTQAKLLVAQITQSLYLRSKLR